MAGEVRKNTVGLQCPPKDRCACLLIVQERITGHVSITPTWQASTDTVAKLLELGATVDATEKRKQTPLHRACERGRLDVVR